MDGEWLSRNPRRQSRKRDRRSYDRQWSTYEAPGPARAPPSSRRGDGGGVAPAVGPPDRRGDVDVAAAAGAGARAGTSHSHRNPYAGRGGGASRIRVADMRGAAARVGALPAADGPRPPSARQGGEGPFRRDAAADAPLFDNPRFLRSLAHPPPISASAELPPALRATLNDAQRRVVESALSGHSTFFTGPAGSGKSHVLSTLLRANDEGIGSPTGRPRRIVVTATTGVAACNVGGVTINSFAGVGTGTGSLADVAKRVLGNEHAKARWREVDVLVIDEISMMGGSLLDKLSFVASRARNDRRPFGGVQLVVCGDFFQLPPIDLGREGFAFEAKAWGEVVQCSILLKQVFRQEGDAALIDILGEARVGELSHASAEALRRHQALGRGPGGGGDGDGDDGERVVPTLLECKNRQVDRANERAMARLPGEARTFKARDRAINDAMRGQLKHCQAPPELDLKVGAQVMLLKNVDLERGLANGSRGVVVGFQRPKSVSEVPTGFKKSDLPVVKFDSVRAVGREDGDDDGADEDNEFTIHPEEWTNKMGDQTVSSRVQIPLRPAWAISVHKSQGMTIPNLAVNLAGVFEYGQAYVALSRATELRLLTLKGFSANAFRAHPKVKAFYHLLDGGCPNLGQLANKENVASQHHGGDRIGDLCDPFEEERPMPHPYGSGRTNPYSQCKQAQPFSSRPPQRRPQGQAMHAQTSGRFSPVPQSGPKPPPASTGGVSPALTQDQITRMEENRRRALAIRLKRQNDSSR